MSEAATFGPVAILGAGKMGMQIGLEYALGGCQVVCIVRRPDKASRRLDELRRMLSDLELFRPGDLLKAQRRMIIVVHGRPLPFAPGLIVESLPEEWLLKVELLGDLAATFPTTVIASNTSSFSITELGRATGANKRIIGTHYLNPPILMPLVEVIPGMETAPGLVDHIEAELESLGKHPVRLKREISGFVWNRLQFALLREALWLVEQDVVEPAVIDDIIERGLARRWRATGLFGTIALGGVETFIRAAATIVPALSDQWDLSDLRKIVEHGPTDELETRRNQLLAADLRQVPDSGS